jgi:hypothetical protein
MITLQDCFGMSDATPEEVVVVASHEKVPPVVAASRVYTLLLEPWGPAAMRQMILDEYCRAGVRKDDRQCDRLAALYERSWSLHPGGDERRRIPR